MTENIFIATLGVESQVVTLALDALLARGEKFARVIIVHTTPDREPIQSSLERLRQEFVTRCFYGNSVLFVPHLLAAANGPLVDVVTGQEMEDAFQSLYTLLRQYKQAGYHIHLSIAGGRKTMTLFAMAAAQILFDSQDYVWHLVSSPELVLSRQLHAPSPKDVALVSVPVARWGRFRPDDRSRAADFIQNVLTPAERELAELLVREGLSNAALAEQLGKSIKTVANQLSSIYTKLAQYYDLSETPDRALLLVLLGSYS